MAQCVVLNSDGTLSPVGVAVADCPGYVLVSGSEYGVFATVQQAFALPTVADAQAWFIYPWAAVLGMYVVGRLVGSVVSMFRS